MIAAGYEQITGKPDIFIVNTCSVTHKAEREARQLVYKTKRDSPDTKIVVTGCSATYWLKTGTYNDLPIDVLVDNTNKEYLVELLQKQLKKKPTTRTRQRATDKFISAGRMVIKIQDGCHRFCSFCIVPYLRGLPRSRSIADIVASIQQNANGMSEVILTAINTEAFGKDSGEVLLDLIKTILASTDVPRLSFGSVHPWSITDEFIEWYRQNKNSSRFAHFFHIPLQSGSNKTLTMMKRCHTREDMLSRVQKIADLNPFAFIATDIISGFLEESDDDFADTYDFLEKSPVSKFHVFRFSKRQMTAAFHLAKRVKEPDDKVKQERSKLLRELSDKKYKKFQESMIGYTSEALVINNSDAHAEVLTNNQVPVFIDGANLTPGSMMQIEITDYKKGKLFGKII